MRVMIWWASEAQWKAVDADGLEAADRRMGDLLRHSECRTYRLLRRADCWGGGAPCPTANFRRIAHVSGCIAPTVDPGRRTREPPTGGSDGDRGVVAAVRRIRSAGSSSTSRPRRPAEQNTVGQRRAPASTTVGSGRRQPRGEMAPTTEPLSRSATCGRPAAPAWPPPPPPAHPDPAGGRPARRPPPPGHLPPGLRRRHHQRLVHPPGLDAQRGRRLVAERSRAGVVGVAVEPVRHAGGLEGPGGRRGRHPVTQRRPVRGCGGP